MPVSAKVNVKQGAFEIPFRIKPMSIKANIRFMIRSRPEITRERDGMNRVRTEAR
jgi:hypothetical protein